MIPVLYTTFNRLEYTRKTLPALCENTPQGEITIIDNGSTDGTRGYLFSKDLAFPNIKRIILNTQNSGISAAMNEFFAMTVQDPYVAKVDNDTLVHEHWLDGLMFALIYEGLDAVQAKHHFCISGVKDWDDLVRKSRVSAIKGGNVIHHGLIGGSPVVFRRKIFEGWVLAEHRNLYGWSDFQQRNPGLKTAFFDGVEADLLDMEDYNRHRADIDKKYYNKTGRTLWHG